MASVNLNANRSKPGAKHGAKPGANRHPSRAESAAPAVPQSLGTATRVMTPENIAFEYQLAGPFRRIVAYVADILISLVGFGIVALAVWMLFLLAIGNAGVANELWGLLSFFTFVAFFVTYWFYGAITETYMNGQTFGKKMSHLRVMTVDGHAIDGVQATLRNFFRLLDMAPMASVPAMLGGVTDGGAIVMPTCLIGLIAMTINKRYQRIGDMVAGTMVIHEEPRQLVTLADFSDPRVALLAERIPPSFVVSAKLSRAISEYVDGRRHLAPQRANEIAAHVARPLLARFGVPFDTDADLFLCALYVRTFADQLAESQQEPVQPTQATPVKPDSGGVVLAVSDDEGESK